MLKKYLICYLQVIPYFFCKANRHEAEALRDLLLIYESWSGQKINLLKSHILFSPNVLLARHDEVAGILSIPEEDNLGFYLGLPTKIGRRKVDCFSYIRDKVSKRIQGWKASTLTRAGKAVLIKAIAQSIPTYVMGVIRLPDELCDQIEKLMNGYWWSSQCDNSGIRWMTWRRMALPKASGVMGFRTLWEFNTAMLAKQGWRLLNENNSLAAWLLKCKYFPRSDFLNAEIHEGNRPSFAWRSIMSAQYLLREGCRKRVGDGTSISVWEDKWLPDFPYRIATPYIGDDLIQTVSDLIIPGTRSWNRDLIFDTFSPEDCAQIFSLPLSRESKDGWIWLYDARGNYTVKSGHHRAVDLWRMEQGLVMAIGGNHWRYIWSSSVPEKVKIWHWRACHDVVPVCSRLVTKGVECLVICPVCDMGVESLTHFIKDCSLLQFVMNLSSLRDKVHELNMAFYGDIMAYIGMHWSKHDRDLWMTLVWMAWDARNKLVFEQKFPIPNSILFSALRLLNEWNEARMANPSALYQKTVGGLWSPPTLGWIKINSDGAVQRHERKAGIGLITRDSLASVLGAKAMPIEGIVDPLVVETIGLLEGMR